VFDYLNPPAATFRFNNVRADVGRQLHIIEDSTLGGQGLVAHWEEFFPTYMVEIQSNARSFLTDRIIELRNAYLTSGAAQTPEGVSVLGILNVLQGRVSGLHLPGFDPSDELPLGPGYR